MTNTIKGSENNPGLETKLKSLKDKLEYFNGVRDKIMAETLKGQ